MQRTLDKIVIPESIESFQKMPSAEGPYILTLGKTNSGNQIKRPLSNISEEAYKRVIGALEFFNKQNFNVIHLYKSLYHM